MYFQVDKESIGATNNDAVSETQLKELLLHEERISERF